MPATPKPQERVTGRVRTAKVQDFRRDAAELAPDVEVRVLVPVETPRLSSLSSMSLVSSKEHKKKAEVRVPRPVAR